MHSRLHSYNYKNILFNIWYNKRYEIWFTSHVLWYIIFYAWSIIIMTYDMYLINCLKINVKGWNNNPLVFLIFPRVKLGLEWDTSDKNLFCCFLCDSHGAEWRVHFTRICVIFAITCLACPPPARRSLRNDAPFSTGPFTVVGITPSWFLADSRKPGRALAISSSQVSFPYVLFRGRPTLVNWLRNETSHFRAKRYNNKLPVRFFTGNWMWREISII